MLAMFSIIFIGCNSQLQAQPLDCVRIHIRANSNSEEDQAVKLKVRDKVTDYLCSNLVNCKTKDDALFVLNQKVETLEQIANQTLKSNGFSYSSKIKISSEKFPEKNYDDYCFPEGIYDALIINLGTGTGNNWWCVAFPPLCFVPDNSNGEKIVYKSWIKEKLDQLFSGKK